MIADLTDDEAREQGLGAQMLEEKYGAKTFSIIKDKDVKKFVESIGVVLQVGKYKYYIPMSSLKQTDYQIAGDRYGRRGCGSVTGDRSFRHK